MVQLPHFCGGDNMTSYLKMATIQEKEFTYFSFSKQSSLWKRNAVTEPTVETMHIQIILLPSEIDIQWWSNV
jgi:hypothetical protein